MSTVTTKDGTKIYYKDWGTRQRSTSSRAAYREGAMNPTVSAAFARFAKGFALALATMREQG